MFRKSLMLSLMTLAACTQNPGSLNAAGETPGIIRGTAIAPEEPISQSIVAILANGSRLCTGVLLKNDVVLTAAHCLDIGKHTISDITVRLNSAPDRLCGSAMLSDAAYTPDAVRNSDGVHQPDLVVLKLSKELCGAKPAKLASRAAAVGEVVTAAGFGIGTASASIADRVDIKRINSDWDSVEALYSDFDWNVPTDASQLRTLRKNRDEFATSYDFALAVQPNTSICNGDSGGPVYIMKDGEVNVVAVNGALLGNRKRGVRECNYSYIQLITPITPSAKWIAEQLQ